MLHLYIDPQQQPGEEVRVWASVVVVAAARQSELIELAKVQQVA